MSAKTKNKRPVVVIESAHNARRVPVKHRYVTETVGWFGAVFVLAAYVLASFGGLNVHTVGYQVLNLLGALCILTIATAKHVRQSMVVNAFWALMAVFALVQIVLLHR